MEDICSFSSGWHKFVLLFLPAGWMAVCASFVLLLVFFLFSLSTTTTDHRTSRPKRTRWWRLSVLLLP